MVKYNATHQRVRAILKKQGLEVGHNYKGRIFDCFSGGLEVTKTYSGDVKVSYCNRTMGKDFDTKIAVKNLINAERVLKKFFKVEKDKNKLIVTNKN